jgi:hypothetical protein
MTGERYRTFAHAGFAEDLAENLYFRTASTIVMLANLEN